MSERERESVCVCVCATCMHARQDSCCFDIYRRFVIVDLSIILYYRFTRV